jgi:hypothetical protein
LTTSGCIADEELRSGDFCSKIEQQFSISLAQFLSWNTGVNAQCEPDSGLSPLLSSNVTFAPGSNLSIGLEVSTTGWILKIQLTMFLRYSTASLGRDGTSSKSLYFCPNLKLDVFLSKNKLVPKES